MLHSSQTVIRQTYYYDNASNANIKYNVDSEENSTIDATQSALFGEITDTPVAEQVDIPEHSNFSLAKSIIEHKSSLITTLAHTPISALWLITKLEQGSEVDKEDSQYTGTLEQIEIPKSSLEQHYDQATTALLTHGIKSFEFQEARRNLIEEVAEFPFYAEQLKELATFVFFVYYSRLQQTSHYIFKPHIHDAVVKKLNTLSKKYANKQLEQLKTLQLHYCNNDLLELFLLPADDQEHTLLMQLVQQECNWLKARQELASANHRLVLYLANQYKGGFLDFNDLVQEGQSGLLKAVDRFDYTKGFQFSTYAAYWIRQAISRALIRNERVVRLPFGQMANISKLHRIKEMLFTKHGFEPSTQELAEHMGLSEAEVNNLLFISQTATSLDTPVGEDDNAMTKADFIEQQVYEPALTSIFRKELIETIHNALNSLSSKEAQVISCRFGINTPNEMTLEEIGQELHLTRERVRQIQVGALKKLQHLFGPELSHFL